MNYLNFILNAIANDTTQLDTYKRKLLEYCGDNNDFKMRINNVLELLKLEVE